jgi:hypothetical protein
MDKQNQEQYFSKKYSEIFRTLINESDISIEYLIFDKFRNKVIKTEDWNDFNKSCYEIKILSVNGCDSPFEFEKKIQNIFEDIYEKELLPLLKEGQEDIVDLLAFLKYKVGEAANIVIKVIPIEVDNDFSLNSNKYYPVFNKFLKYNLADQLNNSCIIWINRRIAFASSNYAQAWLNILNMIQSKITTYIDYYKINPEIFHGKFPTKYKIKTKFKSQEIAYFFKLLKDTGYLEINEREGESFYRIIADTFKVETYKDINNTTFKNDFLMPKKNAVKSMITILTTIQTLNKNNLKDL